MNHYSLKSELIDLLHQPDASLERKQQLARTYKYYKN